MKSSLSFVVVLAALTGCQGTFPGINGLSQPGRVPPPATGSYQIPGAYSGAPGAPPADPSKSVSSTPGAPWVDQVAAAQNQLKQATDNARAAVLQSTQQIQSQVEQASARADRFGAGVVQASQVLNEAAQAPPPPPPSISAWTPPTPASGSLSDQEPVVADDPNAQWRKPVPR
jgi:hypothetical protein